MQIQIYAIFSHNRVFWIELMEKTKISIADIDGKTITSNIFSTLSTTIYKISIVDDDVELSQMLAQLLKNRGHDVIVFNSGIDYIRHVRTETVSFDLIFMDFNLDKLTGIDVVECLRQSERGLIFAFTGDDSENTLSKFRSVGMTGALIKPLNVTVINGLMGVLEKKCQLSKNLLVSFMDKKKSKKQLYFFK